MNLSVLENACVMLATVTLDTFRSIAVRDADQICSNVSSADTVVSLTIKGDIDFSVHIIGRELAVIAHSRKKSPSWEPKNNAPDMVDSDD